MADTTVSNGFLVRTRGLLRRALQDVVNVASRDRSTPLRPDLPDDDLKILQELIDASLSGRGGEASARGNAAQLGRYYLDLNDDGRVRFFQLLAAEYGVDSEGLNQAMDNVRTAVDSPGAYTRAVDRLRECLRSPRTHLFRQFNSLSRGVKFLVDMRSNSADLDQIDQPGVYQFRDGESSHRFAVNLDESESHTEPLGEDALERFDVILGKNVTTQQAQENQRQLRDRELENSQRLWQWLLVTALGLLGLETFLGAKWSRRRTGDEGEQLVGQ